MPDEEAINSFVNRLMIDDINLKRHVWASMYMLGLLKEKGVREVHNGFDSDGAYVVIRGRAEQFQEFPKKAPNGVGIKYRFYE